VSADFKVNGFVCPGTFENELRSSFDIDFLASGEFMPFAKYEEEVRWINFRKFYFNPEALSKGIVLLKNIEDDDRTAVFVDEIGQWELENGGWSTSLETLLKKKELIKILIIREKFVDDVIKKFNLDMPVVFEIQNVSAEEAFGKIYNDSLAY